MTALRAAWWIATHPLEAVLVLLFAIVLLPVVAEIDRLVERRRRHCGVLDCPYPEARP